MAEGVFPKINGDELYASEVNSFQDRVKEVYVGSSFDNSTNGTTATHELTDVSAADLASYNYIKITMLVTTNLSTPDTSANSATIKIEKKDIGGSYADLLGSTVVRSNSPVPSHNASRVQSKTIVAYGAVTSAMKSTGLRLKISNTIDTGSTAVTTSLGNIQTVVELM